MTTATRLPPSSVVMMRRWRSLGRLVLLVTAVTPSWRNSSSRRPTTTLMFADAFGVRLLPKTKSALSSSCTMTTTRTATTTTTTTFHRQQQPNRRRRVVAMPLLWQSQNNNDQNNDHNTNKLGPKQGVYARPSAAIERGSGFFIPGLKGPKIRLAVGTVLLTATAVNHVLSGSGASSSHDATTMSGNALAESLAVGASVVVWVQAVVQAWQELAPATTRQIGKQRRGQSQPASTGVYETWSAAAANSYDSRWRQRVAWTARTYLALTAARQILYLGGDGEVYYRLSRDDDNDNDTTTTTNDPWSFHDHDDRARAALQETLQASPSGRLALPTTHPAAQYYCPDQACVVVQRIGANHNNSNSDACCCWMISSNTTLAATLTQRDLTWLGPLAQYVVPPKE